MLFDSESSHKKVNSSESLVSMKITRIPILLLIIASHAFSGEKENRELQDAVFNCDIHLVQEILNTHEVITSDEEALPIPAGFFSSSFMKFWFRTETTNNQVHINSCNSVDNTVLHLAVLPRQEYSLEPIDLESTARNSLKLVQLQLIQLLIEHGADVNRINSYGDSIFSKAVLHNKVFIARYLIENVMNLNDFNSHKDLYLRDAISRGHEEMARLFIFHGANLNRGVDRPAHYLERALENGYFELAQLLIDQGIDVNEKSVLGFTPLLHFSTKGDLNSVLMLIAAGADVNVATQEVHNFTALRAAVNIEHAEIASALIHGGADVNRADINGYTPLHIAARNNNPALALALVDAGADVNFASNFGKTPLDEPMTPDLKTTLLNASIDAPLLVFLNSIEKTKTWHRHGASTKIMEIAIKNPTLDTERLMHEMLLGVAHGKMPHLTVLQILKNSCLNNERLRAKLNLYALDL